MPGHAASLDQASERPIRSDPIGRPFHAIAEGRVRRSTELRAACAFKRWCLQPSESQLAVRAVVLLVARTRVGQPPIDELLCLGEGGPVRSIAAFV